MRRLVSFLSILLTSSTYCWTLPSGSFTYYLDALYWQVREGSADNWAQLIPPAGTQQNVSIKDVPFNFSPGFRLGVGFAPENQLWDSSLIYTGYNTTASDSTNGNVFSAFLGNFFAGNTDGSKFGPYYDSGSIRWNFAYKSADLVVGKLFPIDRVVTLHPTIGLKSALINQHIYTNWNNPHSSATPPVVYGFTQATEDLQNNFFGIGPVIGLTSIWPLYQRSTDSVNLIGDIQSSLMWSYWRFKDVYQNNAPTRIAILNNNINGASTMAAGQLAVEWKHMIHRMNIGLKLGYEAEVWFSQLQYYSYNMGRLNNLMSLQGGSLTLSINA